MKLQYHMYVSDRGNIFMTEIAALLEAAIADLGYSTVFPAPGLPVLAPGRVNLVIAPHEFFPLQPGYDESTLLKAAEASVLIGVEQPGTAWFETSAHYASVAAMVLDINTFAVEELRRRGIEAAHLQLGYHRTWDRWGGDPEKARPTDLLFLGSVTGRRESVLSQGAPLLWDCDADIRLFEFLRPMTEPRSNFMAFEEKWDLLASTRVLLNIHRNDVPYFEWVRVLEAAVNGCLVVSEASSDYGPLVPGEHFVAAPVDALCAHAAAAIVDERLRAELATAAYDFLRNKVELATLLEPLCARIDQLPRRPKAQPSPLPIVPLSVESNPPNPPNPLLVNAHDTEACVSIRIKELLDSETQLLQQVEAMQAHVVHGDAAHTTRSSTPAWDAFVPEVSVIVTCYNYRQFITGAMEAVVRSAGVDVEMIVVDDHSSDGSVETIAQAMDGWPWFPTLLLARSANAGVGVAREQAITRARADKLFILDADNLIFPSALRKLAATLDATPEAAFAYGIVAKVGESGLLSFLPWDVPRLVTWNYIDAMAMIRREDWDELGGYDAEASLRGLEDYELWLRLAASGGTGAFLSDFVGLYRVHSGSRQATVRLDQWALQKRFRERYPFLPWPDGS